MPARLLLLFSVIIVFSQTVIPAEEKIALALGRKPRNVKQLQYEDESKEAGKNEWTEREEEKHRIQQTAVTVPEIGKQYLQDCKDKAYALKYKQADGKRTFEREFFAVPNGQIHRQPQKRRDKGENQKNPLSWRCFQG